MKELRLDDEDLGVIHAKKSAHTSTIWLTERKAGSWWVVVAGADGSVHKVGFVRPPQEARARAVYDALSRPSVFRAFLAGENS